MMIIAHPANHSSPLQIDSAYQVHKMCSAQSSPSAIVNYQCKIFGLLQRDWYSGLLLLLSRMLTRGYRSPLTAPFHPAFKIPPSPFKIPPLPLADMPPATLQIHLTPAASQVLSAHSAHIPALRLSKAIRCTHSAQRQALSTLSMRRNVHRAENPSPGCC